MIELKNISKSYDNHPVLQSFSYDFKPGQSYALIGKSGSGKSTLLNMIGRLEQPNAGEILIQGQPLSGIPERTYFRSYLGYLFQNYGLIDNESIYANLKLAFTGKQAEASQQDKLITETLHKVGLSGYALNRKIFSLSGVYQRVDKVIHINPTNET